MAPRKAAAPAPVRLPVGLQLTDVSRLQWRLGAPLGSGGHGAIYAATAESPAAPASAAGYVVKVEPHDSGPLFTEMHCYHRVGRPATISEWRHRRRLQKLGMPHLVGSGSLVHDGQRYRFMVMQRFGSDLQRILDKHGHRFPVATVLHIGLQVLDVLEYLHDQEYIHGDVKAQNLLLGLESGSENQVYLVDYGLACRYANDGRHKPSKPDPKKAHNGTIEFTSRDAHLGAPSRRGDLEVLGYNLLQWCCGRLPWQDSLSNVEAVAAQKRAAMDDVAGLVRGCFAAGLPRGVGSVERFLTDVAALPFERTPDYEALRATLRAGLTSLGSPPAELRFTLDKAPAAVRDRSPLSPLQPADQEDRAGRRGRRGASRGRSSPVPVPQPRGRRKRTNAAPQSPSPTIFDNMTPSMRAVLERRNAAATARVPRSPAIAAVRASKSPAIAAARTSKRATAAAAPVGRSAGARGCRLRSSAVSTRHQTPTSGSDSDSDLQDSFYTPPSGGPTARPPLRRHRLPRAASSLSPWP